MVIVPISQMRNLKLTQPGVRSRNLSEVHLSLKPQVFPADYWSCQCPRGKPVPLPGLLVPEPAESFSL